MLGSLFLQDHDLFLLLQNCSQVTYRQTIFFRQLKSCTWEAKEEHHTLPFKFYRCCGHKMVPEIHSSILSFHFLLFSFHLMAAGKHSFTLLVHKDEMVCWECSVTGMGSCTGMTWNFFMFLQCLILKLILLHLNT